MPKLNSFLRVDQLEDRSLMSSAVLGTPWPDASALSLSFAPDSTSIGAQKSALFKTFDKVSKDLWQREVLRAFQAWAVNSNINIALAPDSGDAFGAPGDSQGDTRFGDIRIGAAALATDSLANVSPFDWTIGTWSGDLLLNSASKFTAGTSNTPSASDLYTVVLHEAGHVFGLSHSDIPHSAMAERYAGVVNGPSSEDIAALQAIYGPRLPDEFEGASGNDSLTSAAMFSGELNYYAVADIGSRTDVDYFTFTVPANEKKFAVRLRTDGLSLLVPSLTVYDSSGSIVDTKVGINPLDPKELEIKGEMTPGSRLTVRVAGASPDDFGIGRYELQMNFGKEVKARKLAFIQDGGADDTIVTAADLVAVRQNSGRNQQRGFAQNAVIETPTDTDYYRLTTPSVGTGTADALTVQVRGLSRKSGALLPAVAVFDASGRPVPANILDSDGPTITLQVPGITRGSAYFVRVSNADGTKNGTGNYRITASVGEIAERGMDVLAMGRVAATAPRESGSLVVENGRLFQFALTATGDANAQLRFSIVDERGHEVFALDQKENRRPESGQIYLSTGRYRLLITQTRGNGNTSYWLQAGIYSDPIGPYAPQVTSPPSPTSPPPATSPDTTEIPFYSDYSGYWYMPMTSTQPQGYYYMI